MTEQTVTGPTVTGPTVTGPTVTGPTVTGPTVTGPTVTENPAPATAPRRPRLPRSNRLAAVLGFASALTCAAVVAVSAPGVLAETTPPLTPVIAGCLADPALQAAVRTSLTTALTRQISTLVAQQTSTDPRGLWMGGDATTARGKAGEAQAAATVAAATGDPVMLDDAVHTWTYLISTYQLANGAFTNDVDSMFIGGALGSSLHLIAGKLSDADRTLLRTALTRAADFLVANHNLTWYTNGNINIGNTVLFAAAYEQTGNVAYHNDFEQALSFAIAPPQARWPGFGLFYTKQPTKADGSDGAAYFAESGGGTPGFDADYTQLQLDQVVRLYDLTNDPRAVRLINLLFNQEWPRVNTADWTLDTSLGTRHPEAVRRVGFNTPALGVLVMRAQRPELAGYLQPQLTQVIQRFDWAVGAFQLGMYYGWGEPSMELVSTMPLP
jgi:hypothetical protein